MAWNEPGGNGKDPWGHNKKPEGPPDLDELFKKMQDKLNDIFGGSGSGSNNQQDNRSMGWSSIIVILVIMLVVWSLFGLYTVQPAEKGVETRFGRYIRTTEQGWHWHIPYPVDQVQKIDVSLVRPINHKALMLTQDENIVEIELIIQYLINQPADYLFNVVDPDDTLHQATESALREIVGTSKMDDVLTSERTRVANDTKKLIQKIVDRYEVGLIVMSVNMQNAQPPAEVQASFADVIKAREDKERHKNQAEAYANEVEQRAIGVASKLGEDALGYKAKKVLQAKGDTERFEQILLEYEKAQEITRTRLYLEAMESVLSNTSKVLIDVENGNNLMYLPLDKLVNSAGSMQQAVPASGTSTQGNGYTLPRSNYPESQDIRSRGGR